MALGANAVGHKELNSAGETYKRVLRTDPWHVDGAAPDKRASPGAVLDK